MEAVPLWGGDAGSPSETMWPGSRPTCKPSSILIRPTVLPQCTNVTDRQDTEDRTDRTDNGPIAQGEPFYKRSPKKLKVLFSGMNCIIETKWYITTNVQQQLRWATVPEQSGLKREWLLCHFPWRGSLTQRRVDRGLYLRPAVCMATIDIGQKWGGCCVPLFGGARSRLTSSGLGRSLHPYQVAS